MTKLPSVLVPVGTTATGQRVLADARAADRIRREWVFEHGKRCSCGGDLVKQSDGTVTRFGWPRRSTDPWTVLQRRDEMLRWDGRNSEAIGHWQLDFDHKTHSKSRDADGKLVITYYFDAYSPLDERILNDLRWLRARGWEIHIKKFGRHWPGQTQLVSMRPPAKMVWPKRETETQRLRRIVAESRRRG